jgi:WXXGXW repeat (2 copies)
MPHARRHLLMRVAVGVMLLLGVSAAAQDVKIHIGLGVPPVPPVVVTPPPQLVVVPGTAVYYAPEAPANLFVYKGRYYTLANNVWSTAPAYNGPWVVIQVGKVPPPILAVPGEYYKIPPGHLKRKGPPPWAGHGHKSKKPKD